MRFTLRSTCFLAVVLYHVKFSFETESSYRPKKSVISRRAIDGTRGRKYYDPVEDGFFDDYSFEGGQFDANEDTIDLEDIRRNVPGEPGIDYPAYQRLPQTSFSCEGRSRGYYADEEAGCQLFHVCDDILVSSFLCPVGSIFSQKLLTCDWWNKVDCSLTRKFYEANRGIYDQDDDEMLRKAYAMTGLRVSYDRKDRGKDGNLMTYVTFDRNGNDLPNNYDDILVDPDYNTYAADYRNEADSRYHGNVFYSQDYRTKAPKTHQDSPIVRIQKITDNHHTNYKHQSEEQRNVDAQKQPINNFEHEFQPSYAPTVPTVTTTTRRYYSPTVPMMFRSTTPTYSKRDQYTHLIESQITPTVPTVFYRQNNFLSTPPNPIGQVRNVDVTNYSEKKREDKNEDYGQEFGEDMEVRESIGLAQSKDERVKGTAEKAQGIKDGDKTNTTRIVFKHKSENISKVVEGNNSVIRNISLPENHTDSVQLIRSERTSTVSPSTEHSDIVVQPHSTNGWNLLTSTIKPRTTSTLSPVNHEQYQSSVYQPSLENVSEPSAILVPPEVDLGFNVRVPVTFFDEEHIPHISSQSESSKSTIEYNPQSSPSRTAIGSFDQVQNTSDAETTYFDAFTTPSPLPVSHLPEIKIPATEIVPPYDHVYAGGYSNSYSTDSEYDGVTEINPFYYESTTNSSIATNDTIYNTTKEETTLPQTPLVELEPPVYNHKDEYVEDSHDINNASNDYEISSSESVSLNYTDDETKLDNVQEHPHVDVVKPKDNYSDHDTLDYVESFKSPDYAQEDDYTYSAPEEQTETTTEYDGTHRILSLLQIMVELAKTNRFPRPFTHNEPLTINVMSTTPPSDDKSHIARFAQINSNFSSVRNQQSKRQNEDFDYPVYRKEAEPSDDFQIKTTVTSSPETTNDEDNKESEFQVTTVFNDMSDKKEAVETEMVSSLGFTLSTEEGRHEFMDAVRRGLISEKNDELPSSTKSSTTESSEVTES